MMRHLLSLASAACLLALLPAADALAVELPIRKAGLWEMKMVRTGGTMPDMTMQHCTDASTDKQMSTSFSPARKPAPGRTSRRPRPAMSAIPSAASPA